MQHSFYVIYLFQLMATIQKIADRPEQSSINSSEVCPCSNALFVYIWCCVCVYTCMCVLSMCAHIYMCTGVCVCVCVCVLYNTLGFST